MMRIERFTLMRPEDNSDTRTTDSQLISDGQMTSVRVPGIEILHQFDTFAGYLLVTDHDCPFEETFHFILLDRHFRIRSRRSLGAGFSFVPTGGVRTLEKLAWEDEQNFVVTLTGPLERWRFTIRRFGVPFLHPRLTATRV
jgi:hypothetical protein